MTKVRLKELHVNKLLIPIKYKLKLKFIQDVAFTHGYFLMSYRPNKFTIVFGRIASGNQAVLEYNFATDEISTVIKHQAHDVPTKLKRTDLTIGETIKVFQNVRSHTNKGFLEIK